MTLSIAYTGTRSQIRDSDINHNIRIYHRMEVSLRRDYTLRLFNVSLVAPDGTDTRRSHIYVKMGSFLSSIGERRSTMTASDNITREIVIPHTGMPRQLATGFVEMANEGVVLSGDSKLTILITNYPACMPEEVLLLRVSDGWMDGWRGRLLISSLIHRWVCMIFKCSSTMSH